MNKQQATVATNPRRTRQLAALKAMLPPERATSGLQVWRRLRRIEQAAEQLALQWCNGPQLSTGMVTRAQYRLQDRVAKVFGRRLPGLFINLDPRGYALKLEPGSVPQDLLTDWGGYQLLAPTFRD